MNGWNEVIGDSADVKGVIYFEVPEDILLVRILGRSATSGRNDDTEEAAKKRFETYTTQTYPIIESFDKVGKCIKVDGS